MSTFENLALETGKMGCKRTWKSPMTSFWFGKFVAGMSTRMGHVHKLNLVLSVELIVGVE